jgi:hypothetical protein
MHFMEFILSHIEISEDLEKIMNMVLDGIQYQKEFDEAVESAILTLCSLMPASKRGNTILYLLGYNVDVVF